MSDLIRTDNSFDFLCMCSGYLWHGVYWRVLVFCHINTRRALWWRKNIHIGILCECHVSFVPIACTVFMASFVHSLRQYSLLLDSCYSIHSLLSIKPYVIVTPILSYAIPISRFLYRFSSFSLLPIFPPLLLPPHCMVTYELNPGLSSSHCFPWKISSSLFCRSNSPRTAPPLRYFFRYAILIFTRVQLWISVAGHNTSDWATFFQKWANWLRFLMLTAYE